MTRIQPRPVSIKTPIEAVIEHCDAMADTVREAVKAFSKAFVESLQFEDAPSDTQSKRDNEVSPMTTDVARILRDSRTAVRETIVDGFGQIDFQSFNTDAVRAAADDMEKLDTIEREISNLADDAYAIGKAAYDRKDHGAKTSSIFSK